MADIADLLSNIQNAKYGREVRGSIYQALAAMNAECEATVNYKGYLVSTDDIDTFTSTGIWENLTASGDVIHWPSDVGKGLLVVYGRDSEGIPYKVQYIYEVNTNKVYHRTGTGTSGWSAWICEQDLINDEGTVAYRRVLTSSDDINDEEFCSPGIWEKVGISGDVAHWPENARLGLLVTEGRPSDSAAFKTQSVISLSDNTIYHRAGTTGGWGSWKSENSYVGHKGVLSSSDDINSAEFCHPGIWEKIGASGNVAHWPEGAGVGLLITFGRDSDSVSFKAQVVMSMANTAMFCRTGTTGGWKAWKEITGGGSGGGITIEARTNIESVESRFIAGWDPEDGVPSENRHDPPENTCVWADGYRTMLHRMMKTYPNAAIYCCAIMHEKYLSATPTYGPPVNSDGKSISQFNEIMKQCCEEMGAHYLEHDKCGINQYNIMDVTVGDGLHPNKSGMDLMARYTIDKLADKDYTNKNCSIYGDSISSYESSRDGNENLTYTSFLTFSGDGTTKNFTIKAKPLASAISSVTIDGAVITTESSGNSYSYNHENGRITFENAPAIEAKIVIAYDDGDKPISCTGAVYPESLESHEQQTVTSVSYTWWHQVIRAKGMQLLKNASIGGRCVTAVKHKSSGHNITPAFMQERINDLKDGSTLPDVIFVKIGINDFNHSATLGYVD